MTSRHHPHRHTLHHRTLPQHARRHHALNQGNTAFLQSAIAPAQASELQTGVPASITIAQAILESSWGNHHIGAANNYFGVKAQTRHGVVDYGMIAIGYVTVPTREHVHGVDIVIEANFRKYLNMIDSFVDHGLFLQANGRYRSALTAYAQTGDADAFAVGLQQAGYATDPHYGELLSSIMKKHSLYQYNQQRAHP